VAARGDAIDAFDRELFWSGADIDKNQWCGDCSLASVRERDLKSLRSDKTRLAPHQIQTGQWFEKALEIVASALDHDGAGGKGVSSNNYLPMAAAPLHGEALYHTRPLYGNFIRP